MFFPDHVDLAGVRDILQHDMRDALIDEALPDVAVRLDRHWGSALDLCLLRLAVVAVSEQVVGVARAHDPRTCKRQRDAGCIDRDPTSSPLFSDMRGRAGAASRVQDEIARVGRHQDTTLYSDPGRLDHV